MGEAEENPKGSENLSSRRRQCKRASYPPLSHILMLRRAICFAVVALSGCTSLGHGGREVPKIARATEGFAEVGLDADDNALSVAVENLLERRGIRAMLLSAPKVRVDSGDKIYTYSELQTRYVLRVRSTDQDHCLPTGGRQMDFYISVVDYQERRRVFLMNGDHGCQDGIVEKLDQWLASLAPAAR